MAAAKTLSSYGVKREIVASLLRSTLADGNLQVRNAAREALRDLSVTGIEHTYNKALYSNDQRIRDRALESIDYFRFKGSLPHLVNVIEVHEIYGGRGSGFIEITRVESYIADYEGLIATQAAILDPIIKQYKTGAILWVSVRVVEVIRRISGVSLGNNPDAWRKWMRSAIL